MKRIVTAAVLGFLGLQMTAQNEVEALRYSMSDVPVTGRTLGMGGAFGAIGSDISSLFTNPAGLGGYRRRGMEISFGLHDVVSSANYMGNVDENARTRFNLNSIGIVGNQKIENSAWKYVSFGFGHGKTNNFYQNINISGISNGSTLMDQFADRAAGVAPGNLLNSLPFSSGLAYETYAIDPIDSLGTSYYPSSASGDIHQLKSIRRTGVQTETSFGVGANYNDFLLIGMTLNFQGVRFREEGTLTESFRADEWNYLRNYSYHESIYSDGTGIGVKLGAIVIPTPWLRAGLAFHSASRISFTETYNVTMNSEDKYGDTWDQSSPALVTEYAIRTPSRYMANLAFVAGKIGVFALDYEYANYDRIKMSGTRNNSYNYSDENKTINEIYKGTHRLRAGMEFRVAEALYVRGGTIYQQSPFISGVGANTSPRMTYTGGVGFRSDTFHVDLSAGYTTGKETYYLYDPYYVDAATVRNNRFMGVLSIGFRY